MATWCVAIDVSFSEKPSSKATFFPDGAFDTKDRKDDGFDVRWYSSHLAAMGEPSLYHPTRRPDDAPLEVYRFLWLRSFNHPIAVRVEKRPGEKARLVLKQLDGKGGYKPGHLKLEKTRTLSDDEWSGLTKQVDECGFWKLSTVEQDWYVGKDGMIVGWGISDGARWILEGTRKNEYRIVDRQSPNDDNHRNAGKYRASVPSLP